MAVAVNVGRQNRHPAPLFGVASSLAFASAGAITCASSATSKAMSMRKASTAPPRGSMNRGALFRVRGAETRAHLREGLSASGRFDGPCRPSVHGLASEQPRELLVGRRVVAAAVPNDPSVLG